jgi:hypothetical protein
MSSSEAVAALGGASGSATKKSATFQEEPVDSFAAGVSGEEAEEGTVFSPKKCKIRVTGIELLPCEC